MLECVEGYEQASPISEEQAVQALRGLAGLHAAAWEDRELLSRIAQRLQRFGGSFALRLMQIKMQCASAPFRWWLKNIKMS